MNTITIDDHYDAWRDAAKRALAAGIEPAAIVWDVREADAAGVGPHMARANAALPFGEDDHAEGESGEGESGEEPGQPRNPAPHGPARRMSPVLPVIRISRALAEQLRDAAQFRDPQRWAFLYQVLWRWHHGDRAVASPADADGARLNRMAKAVRRDQHDLIAYVRFRKRDTQDSNEPEYVAWYEPAHDTLAWGAEHFARRMGRSRWLIATPSGAALWDGSALHLERQHGQRGAIAPDEAEALWLAYYRSTFNPARLNETALHQHMPVRYWKGLPEGPLIPAMISDAKSGARQLAQAAAVGALAAVSGKAIAVEAGCAQPVRDATTSLDACRRCPLWQHATQAVAGEGSTGASILLLGEQPGDQEDLVGRPFVGPAGKLLDTAIERAGLRRDQLYLTNAVKHFGWTPRGKRRLHKTPGQREIEACATWLEQELADVRPDVIVTLGATALGALLGEKVSLQRYLGGTFELDGRRVIATYHPSFALRQDDDAGRDTIATAITDALRWAARIVAPTAGANHPA